MVKITEDPQSVLLELSETGNLISKVAPKKLLNIYQKNEDPIEVGKIIQGQVFDPGDKSIYAFAPCTSVHVERFSSVLNAFIVDRPNIMETTLKMIFIRYNKGLHTLTFSLLKIKTEKNPKFHVTMPISAPKMTIKC